MAYGGRLGGVARPDVAFVGTTGSTKMFLRSTAGGPFRPLSSYHGDAPLDVAIDPGNWHRAYVVDASNRVWATLNGGRSWRNVTGNLHALTPSLTVANGSTSLRTAAIMNRGTSLGGETVLVGGFGGVFALRSAGLGSSRPRWVKLGDGMPNVVVTDVQYDTKDDLVIAGTFGRGAWTLQHPRRSLRTTTTQSSSP
jgi:hypothetical protein